MNQIELNFEAGLTDQFPKFGDCIRASVYDCGKPFKTIAADLDMSPSRLSRMLNESDEGINFPAHRLDELIAVTGDHRPYQWLAERHGSNQEARRKQALNRLAGMMPQLEAILKAVGDAA